MEWAREGWVRVYRRNSADWLAVSWQARFVFTELLKAAEYLGPDRGLVRLGPKGLRGLAVSLGCPAEVVEAAVAELLDDGCVARVEGGLRIRNYEPAQDTPKSNAAKCRDYRKTPKVSEATPAVSETTPARHQPDPSQHRTDTQEEESESESEELSHTHAGARSREAEPAGELAKSFLAELRRHPPLAEVATRAAAEHLAGGAMASGKKPEWVRAAIADAAREAGAKAAVGHPLHAPQLSALVARFCAHAAPPRPAANGHAHPRAGPAAERTGPPIPATFHRAPR